MLKFNIENRRFGVTFHHDIKEGRTLAILNEFLENGLKRTVIIGMAKLHKNDKQYVKKIGRKVAFTDLLCGLNMINFTGEFSEEYNKLFSGTVDKEFRKFLWELYFKNCRV